MTIAVDLGRKATKQTNKQTGQIIALDVAVVKTQNLFARVEASLLTPDRQQSKTIPFTNVDQTSL